ncbi:MAG: thioredoxin domain-containing protein [Deferrisomatales bacterium]
MIRADRAGPAGLILALWGLLTVPLAPGAEGPAARANRLLQEKSPYLLQHAHNPVDWYPWGPEAFDTARRERKLIFLSIGYSTCHWCHVMERESFSDPRVAAVLNAHFVAIKVDREERPDVDQVYMEVCQALTGGGGWPLTILMTPEQLPFFAATYLPKESRGRRVGLIELLERAAALWAEDPDKLTRSGADIVSHLRKRHSAGAAKAEATPELFDRALGLLERRFDAAHGGFGDAPKFPSPHNLVFLLRHHRRTGAPSARRMAEQTLQALRRGGVHDHLGGGFHRYATDARWLVPHFEKMLYDQAGLALAFAEAAQATGDPAYAEVARDTLGYVLRDLRSPGGAFYSAEDADSEGAEGRFYLWTRGEILDVLGAEAGERFCRVYGVAEGGDPAGDDGSAGGKVLHLSRPVADWAAQWKIPTEALARELAEGRAQLLARRARRVRPHRDDKVLAAWNGLAVSAFARASWILGEPAYVRAAQEAARFVWTRMRRDGRLLRRYRDGEAAVDGFARDYAFLARGLLDLYGATFEPRWLERAVALAEDLVVRFWDGKRGGLYDTDADAEALLLRPREVYDGAMPSANSVALEVFARLWLLTGDPRWSERAEGIAGAFAATVADYPAAYTGWLEGAAYLVYPTREVVLAGAADGADTRALVEVLRRTYAPEAVALLRPAGAAGAAVTQIAPFAAGMKPRGGRAAAYVCEGFSCRAPVTDPAALAAALAAPLRR